MNNYVTNLDKKKLKKRRKQLQKVEVASHLHIIIYHGIIIRKLGFLINLNIFIFLSTMLCSKHIL